MFLSFFLLYLLYYWVGKTCAPKPTPWIRSCILTINSVINFITDKGWIFKVSIKSLVCVLQFQKIHTFCMIFLCNFSWDTNLSILQSLINQYFLSKSSLQCLALLYILIFKLHKKYHRCVNFIGYALVFCCSLIVYSIYLFYFC